MFVPTIIAMQVDGLATSDRWLPKASNAAIL
jgi:hypothetical protein